ncbi:MAG: outer membrane beta-barrel protein [Bacteroidota bacterium]
MRFTSLILNLVGVLILLVPTIHARAQVREIVLTGSVQDHEHRALPGVTVSLHRPIDSILVATTLSDSNGIFRFSSVRAGNYYLEIRGIGYQVTYSVTFGVAGRPVTLMPFVLMERPTRLAAVTVQAPSRPLEVKDGKLIFNVDKSISAAGGNAFDLLKRMPGISVDPEDNLLLKGSTAVTVMLDGKMTWLSPQQLSSLLKGMPAGNISRLEVIATPSSQYDAAGNAGIINIVTQKSTKQGYALNIGAGAGTGNYPQTAENLIGNIRTRRFNFFGSYNYDYTKWYTERTSHRVISNDGVLTQYDRASSEPVRMYNQNYKAGVDLYLSGSDELSLLYSGAHNLSDKDAHGPTQLLDGSGKQDSVVQNHNVTQDLNSHNAYTLSYGKKLDTLGKTLSADADYSTYNNHSNGYLGNQLFTAGGNPLQPYQQLNFIQPTLITIRTVKADLVLPFKGIKWAGGLKVSSITTDNNFTYDSLINGSSVYSYALSNHFIYDEKIYAAYGSVHKNLGKNVLEAGLRVENTLSTGNSVTTGQVTKRNYTDLFPYLSLTRDLSGNQTIHFSITRRINRPVYSDLNPFLFFLDKYTYLIGNAYLHPEYAWTGSLRYVLAKSYITTLSYTRTSGAILGFAQQDSATGVLRISDYNFSHKDAFDLLLIAPLTISRGWTMQNTLDLSYLSYLSTAGSQLFKTAKWTVDWMVLQTFSLPRDYAAELTSHYISPSLAGVYVNRHYFSVDGGLKKTVNRQLDIRLSFTDLFHTVHAWGYSVYKEANVQYNHQSDTRRFNLSLVYHFGGKLMVRTTSRSEEQERVN